MPVPVWPHCVCRLTAGAHTRANTCTWGHAGTCSGTQTPKSSLLVVTCTHMQKTCIPPEHTPPCTVVCLTSCDTCTWGERRACVFARPLRGVCRESQPCVRVPGGSGLGLRVLFTPRWLVPLVLPAPGVSTDGAALMPWCLGNFKR